MITTSRKSRNKCVHMTESEVKKLEQIAEISGRRCSQLIHDALTVAVFKPGGVEQRLAESRLAQTRDIVSDSRNSFYALGSMSSDSAEREHDPRFSRLMAEAQRPEVLHG